MTTAERTRPAIMNNQRRRRVANGSGARQEEVGALVKQFEMVGTMMRQVSSLSAGDRVKAVKEMQRDGGMGAMLPGLQGMPGLAKRGSTHTASIKDKFKKRKR